MKPCKKCSRPEIGKTVIHVGKCPKRDESAIDLSNFKLFNGINELNALHWKFYLSEYEIPIHRVDYLPVGTMRVGHHIIYGIAE